MLLNDDQKLAEMLPMLQESLKEPEMLVKIVKSIKNTESPFMDILLGAGREAVAYAMKLSNLCAHKELIDGYSFE